FAAAASASGIPVIPNSFIDEARGRNGRLTAVSVRSNDANHRQSIECDGLLMSVGWAPAGGLLYQAGAGLEYDTALEQVVPKTLPAGLYCAGRLNGVFDYLDQIDDATAAANGALGYLGFSVPTVTRPVRAARPHSHQYPIMPHAKGREFVDFDEDLQVKDLTIAYREGFDSVELMKRYSTIGMGPSQGKTSNMNGVRILGKLQGKAVQAVGVTTPRPFTYPVPMGMLAGRRLRRQWCTPMHEYHEVERADLQEAGTWLRPMSYTRGSPRAAIEREYQMVRKQVGIIDVSTLGKIELFGPDVIPLLEYAYTCSFEKLKQDMTRYIFMVDGSGTLVDDGVAARLAGDHFYLTATSSHAQAVVRQLQQYADQLGFNVAIMDRTFQVAAINLAGPLSADVLSRLTDIDLSPEKFPYLALREGQIAGVQSRVLRVGFVGELGYEIHFPASHGKALWQALLDAGATEGIGAFGVEAQRLLRLEKGHLIFGQDTDGTTNPFEVNLGWGVRLSKDRFVGKHSLTKLKPMLKRRLVGFISPADSDNRIRECHLVIEQGAIAGRVTSVAYSPHLRSVFGLAMVDLSLTTLGQQLFIRVSDSTMVDATVTDMPFYDPTNERQKIHITNNRDMA
ncbi:MAG TPA: aminomethyltransferase, partial [Gammaproteobacteria bacterium]|nr:aminomethyltransferase [Gammaproteobacteria bacterium]